MLSVETDDAARADLLAGLDELVREGARRMLAEDGEAMDRLVRQLRTSLAEHRLR